MADHCSPGDYVDARSFSGDSGPNRTVDCYNDDRAAAIAAGVTHDTTFRGFDINSIELATPMQAGQAYAVSFELQYSGTPDAFRLEVWGTNARCGAGSTATLLHSAALPLDKHIECGTLEPTASYTHLLFVQRQVAENLTTRWAIYTDGASFCPNGTCP